MTWKQKRDQSLYVGNRQFVFPWKSHQNTNTLNCRRCIGEPPPTIKSYPQKKTKIHKTSEFGKFWQNHHGIDPPHIVDQGQAELQNELCVDHGKFLFFEMLCEMNKTSWQMGNLKIDEDWRILPRHALFVFKIWSPEENAKKTCHLEQICQQRVKKKMWSISTPPQTKNPNVVSSSWPQPIQLHNLRDCLQFTTHRAPIPNSHINNTSSKRDWCSPFCNKHLFPAITCLWSISFALSLVFAFAFLRQGIDLHVIWSSPVARCHCHTCLVLCVVLQELKSHCCHRFEGSQVLHLMWDSHIRWCFAVSRNRFPFAKVLLPFVQCDLVRCELWGKGLCIEDCAHETLYSRRCVWRVSRDQRSPRQCSVHVCDSSDHCQCWSSHVHHQDVEEFLGCCHPILCECGSDCRNAHVWARNWILCTCQQCWNVRRQKGHVALHHEAPFAPFVLLSTEDWRLAQFLQIFICDCHRHVATQRVSPSTHCSATMSTS